MSGKRNFLSKGRRYLQVRYNKIMFGLFGTAMALPPALFSNCKGSCGNCYNCLISGTPLAVLVIVSIGRKIWPFKKSVKNKFLMTHKN